MAEIRSTEVGFKSQGCGVWRTLSPLGEPEPAPSGVATSTVPEPSTIVPPTPGEASDAPPELAIYWPDGPPCPWPTNVDLRGLTGTDLRQRQLQLARGFFGFGPEFAEARGFDVPIASLRDGERIYFIWAETALVESRAPMSYTRVGVGARVAPGVGIWTSTRVNNPKEQPTLVEEADVVITNRRVVAVGTTRSRTWDFAELLAVT